MSDVVGGSQRLPCALAPLSLGRPERVTDLVDAALAGGFAGIGLTARTPEGRWLAWAHRPAYEEQVRERLAAHELAVSDIGIVTVDAHTDLTEVDALAACAAAVGAPRVITMCRDPDPQRAACTLREIAAIASARGIQVALEPMPYTALRDVHDALRLVDRVGSSDVGIVLDLFHHVRAGRGPEDLGAEVMERIVLVQLSDGVAAAPPEGRLREEALTDRRYPGEGDFPLAELARPLPAGVPMTVEAPCRRYSSLPLPEQAIALGRATRSALATIRG